MLGSLAYNKAYQMLMAASADSFSTDFKKNKENVFKYHYCLIRVCWKWH